MRAPRQPASVPRPDHGEEEAGGARHQGGDGGHGPLAHGHVRHERLAPEDRRGRVRRLGRERRRLRHQRQGRERRDAPHLRRARGPRRDHPVPRRQRRRRLRGRLRRAAPAAPRDQPHERADVHAPPRPRREPQRRRRARRHGPPLRRHGGRAQRAFSRRPLCGCARTETSSPQVLVRLIEKNADVNAATKTGTVPLHVAAQTGGDAIAAKLIERGARAGSGASPALGTSDRVGTSDRAARPGADARRATVSFFVTFNFDPGTARSSTRRTRRATRRSTTRP